MTRFGSAYATERVVYKIRTPDIPEGNRVYFYNMGDGIPYSGDMILVESNGRFGLIDAGHRYADMIEDEDGTRWTDLSYVGLSSRISGNNGRDAMIYMVETLGVDHLDFIIGTHAHSDHIGGIPEIAELLVSDGNDEPHSLIDENTVYFYKTYHHVSPREDDLGDNTAQSWHNQAFFYRAREAMTGCGARLIDVSLGIKARPGDVISADQTDNLISLESTGVFHDTAYDSRSDTDPYDDRLSFSWGDMRLDLYHLFSVEGAKGENVNSLITVITCGDHKVYLGGDIDAQYRVEQKLAQVIKKDHGQITVAKASHHGGNGSNTRETIDCLQPAIMICTDTETDYRIPASGSAYTSVKYYASKYYGTEFYGVGASDRMLCVGIGDNGIEINHVTGYGENAFLDSPEICHDTRPIEDGWSMWGVEYLTDASTAWYYFEDGEPVTGWKMIGEDRYYFDEQGFMQSGEHTINGIDYLFAPFGALLAESSDIEGMTGWIIYRGKWMYRLETGRFINGWGSIDGKRYFFDIYGRMQTGWCRDRDYLCWYYLKPTGEMAIGWLKENEKWYYLNPSGKMLTGWQKTDGKWYYLKSTGEMVTGWQKTDSKWYYLTASGAMKTGWLKDGGKWYYLEASGAMVSGTSKKINGKEYRFGANGVCRNP